MLNQKRIVPQNPSTKNQKNHWQQIAGVYAWGFAATEPSMKWKVPMRDYRRAVVFLKAKKFDKMSSLK